MHRITPVARVLLGLTFVVFSLNYFVPFLPAPPPPPEGAMAFVMAFSASGLLTLVKIVELAAGAALLANRAVPLALALLAPIVVGIAGFHLALAPAGTALALALVALELVLAWSYRAAFAPMLAWRVAPTVVRALPAERGAVARAA